MHAALSTAHTALTADTECPHVLAVCCWLSSVGWPVHHVRVSVVYCYVQVDIWLCCLLSHFKRYVSRCISTAEVTRVWLPHTCGNHLATSHPLMHASYMAQPLQAATAEVTCIAHCLVARCSDVHGCALAQRKGGLLLKGREFCVLVVCHMAFLLR
jgi:hypothetical protein